MTDAGRRACAALVLALVAAACGDVLTGPEFAGEPYITLRLDRTNLPPIEPGDTGMVNERCWWKPSSGESVEYLLWSGTASTSVLPLYTAPNNASGMPGSPSVCLLGYTVSPGPRPLLGSDLFRTSTGAIARQDILVLLTDAAQLAGFRRSHPRMRGAEKLKVGYDQLRTTCAAPEGAELRVADDEPIALDRVPWTRLWGVRTPTTSAHLPDATCAERSLNDVLAGDAPAPGSSP